MQLATRFTPIHRWRVPGVPEGFEVSVKRDDMTGSALSGNKVCNAIFMAFKNIGSYTSLNKS